MRVENDRAAMIEPGPGYFVANLPVDHVDPARTRADEEAEQRDKDAECSRTAREARRLVGLAPSQAAGAKRRLTFPREFRRDDQVDPESGSHRRDHRASGRARDPIPPERHVSAIRLVTAWYSGFEFGTSSTLLGCVNAA